MDILAGNHLARALYTDSEALPTRSRNNQRTHGTKRLRHPVLGDLVLGDLVLGYEAFIPVDDPEQTLSYPPSSRTRPLLNASPYWPAGTIGTECAPSGATQH
ncbi:hypothetical protein ACWC4J_42135 [Streptomyces sp. NPDC001356]